MRVNMYWCVYEQFILIFYDCVFIYPNYSDGFQIGKLNPDFYISYLCYMKFLHSDRVK